MFGFGSLCDSPRNGKRRKLAGGHAGLISGRIKPGFVLCPRARISWMIVLVSIWVLIILLAGGDERTYRRTEEFGRVANNCCGVESAFCNPIEVISIESFTYSHGIYVYVFFIKFLRKITIIFVPTSV